MTFEQAVSFVLEREGGYVNDPSDPGGETKFGISKRSFPALNIAALTIDGAKDIYRREYWDRCHCDQMPNGLDLLLFDAAVNQGVGAAVKMLQRGLNITDDGIVGPATLQHAHDKADSIVSEFVARRAFQYAVNPKVHTYGLGWFRRLALATEAAYGSKERT